jgi:hypothetical protein
MKFALIIILSYLINFSFAVSDEVQNDDEEDFTTSGYFGFVAGNQYTEKSLFKNHNEQNIAVIGNLKTKFLTKFNDKVKYGFISNINLDSSNQDNPVNINEANFIISVKKRGARIFGLQNSIASKIRVDSTTFNPYSGGVNGEWQRLLMFPYGSFLTSQGLMMEQGLSSTYSLHQSHQVGKNRIQPYQNWSNSNLGFAYVGDRLNGFRFAISYFFDNKSNLLFQKNNLTDKTYQSDDLKFQSDIFLKDILSTGFNYYNYIGNFEFAVSVTYELGKYISNKYKTRRLNSYALGFNASYFGFTFGGSFTNFNKGMRIKSPFILGSNAFENESGNKEEAGTDYIYDFGLGYSIDRYSISLSYLKSRYINNEFWSGVLSFEVQPTDNLVNYFQVVRYQFTKREKLNAIQKNNGFVLVFGIKYLFKK